MLRLIPHFMNEVYGLQARNSCCASGLNISEDSEKVYVDAPIPGAKSEDVEVTLNQETRLLKISAQSKLSRENAYFHLKGSDRYHYEIPLAQAIDVTKPIEASCKEGMLTIVLHKSRAPEPIKVQVKVA